MLAAETSFFVTVAVTCEVDSTWLTRRFKAMAGMIPQSPASD
jgi:hypothetical protein